MKHNTIYWDTYKKHLDYSLHDYLVPALTKRPDWFKTLKQDISRFTGLNVSTCPSFVDLFKKSLLYKSPCDILIEVQNRNLTVTLPENSNDWFHISTHSDYDGIDQMGTMWNNNLKNFKLNTPVKISGNSKFEGIFMDPMYYNYNTNLRVAPGTLTITRDYTLQPNLNMFIDISEDSKTHIKAGEVLALVYFPNGVPRLKEKELKDTPKRKFIGDYLSRLT